jgi:hypothetical protein
MKAIKLYIILCCIIFSSCIFSSNQNNQENPNWLKNAFEFHPCIDTKKDEEEFKQWVCLYNPNILEPKNTFILTKVFDQWKRIRNINNQYLTLFKIFFPNLIVALLSYNPFTDNSSINIEYVNKINFFLNQYDLWQTEQNNANAKKPINHSLNNLSHNILMDQHFQVQALLRQTKFTDLGSTINTNKNLISNCMHNFKFANEEIMHLYERIQENLKNNGDVDNTRNILQNLIPLIPKNSIEWINPKTGQNISHLLLCPLHWINPLLNIFLQTGADLCIPTSDKDKFPGSTIPTIVAYMKFGRKSIDWKHKESAFYFIAEFIDHFPNTFNQEIRTLLQRPRNGHGILNQDKQKLLQTKFPVFIKQISNEPKSP